MFLPCDKCRGKCCTYPAFSPSEFQVVKLAKGLPPDAIVMPMQIDQYYRSGMAGAQAFVLHRKDGTCPYLVDGKCSIYAIRPQVCKDYGMTSELPCEYLYPKEAKQKQDERIRRSRP